MVTSAYPILRRTIIPLLLRRFQASTGLENLPSHGPYILAANHISYADPALLSMFIALYCKQKVFFLTAEYVYNYFQKLHMDKWLGFILVPDHDRKHSLSQAEEHLRHGGILGIYPEGQINLTHELLAGKTGAVRLSLATGAPIVPIGVFGPQTRNIRDAWTAILTHPEQFSFRIGPMFTPTLAANELLDRDSLQRLTFDMMKRIGMECGKVATPAV